MRLLLTLDDVNPNKSDNDGQTPILAASTFPDEGVVRLLLTRDDVNPDKHANNGKTSLPDNSWRSQNLSFVRKPMLHLAATVGKLVSFDPALILPAVIAYLVQLPLSPPRSKRTVLYQMQMYH